MVTRLRYWLSVDRQEGERGDGEKGGRERGTSRPEYAGSHATLGAAAFGVSISVCLECTVAVLHKYITTTISRNAIRLRG